MAVSSATEVSQVLAPVLSQNAVPSDTQPQPSEQSYVEWFSRQVEHLLYTWPTELSNCAFAFAKVFGLDIVSPETRRKKILEERLVTDVTNLILEYTVPCDIEDDCRQEMERVSRDFDQLSNDFLQKLEANARFLKLVERLDIHDIELVKVEKSWPEGIGSKKFTCYAQLQAIAAKLPNLKQFNLSNCRLENNGWENFEKLFDQAEVIDISQNNLSIQAESHGNPGWCIENFAKLPNLKKLIVTGNEFSEIERTIALEKFPRLEII